MPSCMMDRMRIHKNLKTKVGLIAWLFGVNLFISSFTFGGGYVVVPMIRKYFVTKRHLFSEEELVEMAAVAQSSPGAIAINLSSLAGYKVAGILGVCVSAIAAILPLLVILSIISNWYAVFASNEFVSALLRGMQAGVAALIIDFVIDMTSMIVKQGSLFHTLMIPLVFILSFGFQVNVVFLLLGCCGLCLTNVWWKKRSR